MNLNIFSDLRKPGLVPGESLSLSTKFNSVLEKNQTYIMSNRMRTLHMHSLTYYFETYIKPYKWYNTRDAHTTIMGPIHVTESK